MRPTCSVYMCTGYGFKYGTPDGGEKLLCEECATALGLSSGGKSCPDRDAVKSAEEIEREQAAKLLLTPEQLVQKHSPAASPPIPKPKGRKMASGRKVKRNDTGEEFANVKAAAQSVGGTDGGLCGALTAGRPFKGVEFSYVDAPAPTGEALKGESIPTITPFVQKTRVGAKAEGVAMERVVQRDTPVSITSVFAALSSMAAGMKGLRLTDIEITAGEVRVKVAALELVGS